MFSFRSRILFSLAVLCWGANVLAQNFPIQSQQMAQPRMQQAPMQQQQVQQQQIQTPPFGTQGGTSVYHNPNQIQPAAQPVVPQTPMGTNFGQPANVGQPPVRVATSNLGPPVGQPVPLYSPSEMNPNTQIVQPTPQGIPQGMQHMGRSEPAHRIIPFFLSPEEQRELDEFLARWERYSAAISQYDVNFNLLMFDPTLPGAQPNQPHKRAFGHFKYNANPRRFVYAVEGEWQGERQIKWDDRNSQHIFAEKVIIDDKSVYQYDYNAKTVRQINVPPEMIGKGIADSPLPLIFGAKADDLKRRFSMRIVNIPGRDDVIWLHARPLLPEDQQEFKELEILLDKRTLAAQGLKQWDINDKAYKVFDLRQPQVNPRILGNILDYIKETFTPDTPRGWKREERNWLASPPSIPAMQQPQMGNLPQHPPQRSEVPLYRVQ